MKNRKIISILSSVLLISTILTGCGSSSINKEIGIANGVMRDSVSVQSAGINYGNNLKSESMNMYGSTTSVSPSFPSEDMDYVEEETTIMEENIKITEDFVERKIVYSADIQVQTKNMEEAQEQIYTSIDKYEGYIENEEFSNNGDIYGAYDYQRRNLRLSIRIPSKNFNEFINGLENDNIYIQSLNKGSKDFSEAYYDKESRISSLRVQEERLLELLKDAANVDIMLQIESRLSDIRYEIESLTKELKYIDARVEYSTIHLYINEVVKYDVTDPEPKNFFEEIIEEIKYSAEDFVEWLKDLLIFIIHIFPYGVILLVIALLIRKFIKKRKAKKLEKKKQEENDDK